VRRQLTRGTLDSDAAADSYAQTVVFKAIRLLGFRKDERNEIIRRLTSKGEGVASKSKDDTQHELRGVTHVVLSLHHRLMGVWPCSHVREPLL
jgi:hypothetical protein